MIEIKAEKEHSQHAVKSSIPAGPTFNPLANAEIENNRAWARRYEELNGEADL